MAEHSTLTGASLHEPKGASTASANTVLTADGVGATSWATITTSNINTSSLLDVNKHKIVVDIPDVSTADFVLVPITNACTLTKVTTRLHTTLTVADAILTVTNSNGPVTIGTITITQAGSAEGDADTLTPTSNNAFTSGTYLKIATDGGSTTASRITILLDFTQTG